MPDFTTALTLGGSLAVWTDLAVPPRTAPLAGKPHLYWSVPIGTPLVRFSCTVGGVLTPLDAALGGRLFLWSWVAKAYALPITPTLGQTSIATVGPFTSAHVGHYRILCWRPLGGATSIQFVVE